MYPAKKGHVQAPKALKKAFKQKPRFLTIVKTPRSPRQDLFLWFGENVFILQENIYVATSKNRPWKIAEVNLVTVAKRFWMI